jgi:ABC-2 type transport system permease protein
MKRPAQPGILLVAAREWRWMRRDRLALFLAIGVPIIAFTLLAATFSNAVIRNLQVSVVDADRSPTSLVFVQAMASAPGVSVAERSGDMTSAMHAIRSGDAIAAIYIPENFERDLVARQRPRIVVLYNRQYFTPGNNASSALSKAIAAATATLPPTSERSASFAPGSLVVEQYVLTNPALNYAQFLLRAILPTVLHVIVAIAAGYAVGTEFSRRSRRAWLRAAGGSPLAALVGKLAPLFGIFVLMMVVEAGIIHGLFEVPFRGDSVLMGAAACLLVIAYLAFGSLVQLLVGNLALGLSLAAIVCNPAFGFAGIGFPVLAMEGFARVWGMLLPLRWYMQILFDQAVRGLPTSVSAEPFMILGGLASLLFGFAWWRLRVVARTVPARAREPAPVESADTGRGIGAAMVGECRRILNDRGVFSLIVMAPVIYGLLYPQPYLGQLLRRIPIAVVDQDHTELSRNLVEALNADEAVAVAVRADTLADAQAALARHRVFAILGIPEGTEREVLKGRKARLPAYVDSAYFLLYNRTLQGITEASGAVTVEIAAHGARTDGSLAHAALIRNSPVELLSQPLFNPTGGYASYIVPAAFLLILQQTLLLGAATLGGVAFEEGGRQGRRRRAGGQAIIGQALAHLCLAMPGLALHLIVLPHLYGFSTLGRPLDLFLMAVPFVLSVSFLAQFVSLWFKRRETAVLLFIAAGMPLLFLVGVSWPVEAIPDIIRSASRIFPSTSAIDGLVRINQMGATLHDVSRDWMDLWILTGVYGLFAMAAAYLSQTGLKGFPPRQGGGGSRIYTSALMLKHPLRPR